MFFRQIDSCTNRFLAKMNCFFLLLIVHAVLFGQTWTFMSQRFKILPLHPEILDNKQAGHTCIVLKHIGPELLIVLFWAL